jgi:hypothetical protein
MSDTTHDDLVKQACEWRENGSPPEPFYAVGHLIDAMADRIEELEAKLAAERGRIADLERRLKLWVPQNIAETGRLPIRKRGE